MINLHNHSTWSDGQYTAEHLVKSAVVHGLTHLGISDHYTTLKLGTPELCVDVNVLPAYLDDLHRLADQYGKWVQVLAGLEVDWSGRAAPYLPALWPQIDRLEYVLFEYVGDPEWSGDGLDALIELLPSIGIPAGLAHNNLRNFSERHSPEELVCLLEANHLFIELSTSPGTSYYRGEDPYTIRVWELLAESDVRFSIGSDTHHYIDDVAKVADAQQFLAERGLLGRLITEAWDPAARTWSTSP